MRRSIYVFIALVFYLIAPSFGADDDLDPDTYRNVTELITARGYPCEQYYATTQDGFILSIQRIPYGISGPSNSTQVKPVVYLMHGFLDASTTWVINGEVESLGFILADAGFDVWMGNSRGNVYSRGNLYYDTTQSQLWAFSYDEMAQYDLPAIYDLVLSETGVDQLIHVGHSQGTAQAFAAYSTYPEIASKVKLFIALAPIVYLTHQDSLLLSTFAKLPDSVVYDLLGDKAFPPDTTWFNTLETYFPDICVDFTWACESVIFLIGGCNSIRTCDPGNMNQSRIEVYSAHIGGASVQDLVHFLQATRSEYFPMYNYDSSSANEAHYGTSSPPNYDVTKMTVPTALFYGGRDGFADPTDVERLIPLIQNLVFTHYEPTYEHLDFVWGMDAYSKIYNLVVELVNKYW